MSQLTQNVQGGSTSNHQEQISATIVRTVAEAEGVDPTDLDPLYYTVDTDQLERLVRSDRQGVLEVSFPYHGYEVRIGGDGEVELDEA